MSADRDRVVDAFDAAVTYWHQQLDEPITEHSGTDRPGTARDYFENHRGFDADTIDEWRLGWAPADGGLYDHLEDEGFDAGTIAATGLFCEADPTKELWRGRYVLPYFTADGRAEYAIARCTGSKGGGSAGYDGHSEDFLAGKYAKVAHSRENVPLSEPILGLQTLEGADEVVVAEGIADAISATEAGYAVLSPVTKEFKREHFDAVVDAVDEHDISRVYVVPDAEQASFSEIDSDDVPDEPEHIYEAITQPVVAPGPAGGLRTANYLADHGIDARVVELPRPSGAKVDLDDYIQNWEQPLGPVLRSAKPPQDHPKFADATATQDTDETGGESVKMTDSDESEPVGDFTPTGAGSGIYDLGLGDVNPSLEAGYRGKNPLGHTGSSENYFVVNEVDGTLFAKDYKRPGNPTYNGLTYLLVDIDERPVEGPQGPLTPRETWLAWAEARKRGLLDCGDAIPTKALEHVAREEGLYNFDALDADLRDDDAELPAKAHNRALWWVNNRWAEEADVDVDDDDENATSKTGRSKTGPAPRTWEDVRYIYDESKEDGRRAARTLLSTRYDLMTVEETNSLRVYDPTTGVYTDETGELRAEIYDGLKSHWSTHELNEVLAGLRQHNIVPKHELNGTALDGPHICVENGALDLLNRDLKDHSPQHYFVDRVPVAYDRDADTSPHDEFVDGLVKREEDKQALFEMVGHALTPDANERWKKFLILTGDADNGKSAFYGRVKALLDGPDSEERNTSAVKLAKMAQNRFSVYSMYGSMANIAGEIDGKKIRNTAAIKDIPGGDPVELEPKGGDSFFDTVNTTLMFAANDPPIIGERDKEAIATRIVPVELPYTFTDDPDPDDPTEKQAKDEGDLEAELDSDEARSGLLNLALDGIERLEASGGDVSIPEPPEERLRMYERSADPMREFGERCLSNEAGDYVVKADVTTVYKEFATAEGYELGSNVGSVLHDVLRGVPGLNYTESRKRSPNYAETGLPLRAWEERKFVVDRVTLTEEGLKYAEEAGLVEDEDEEEDEEHAAQLEDLQAGIGNLRVTVAEKLEPPEWLQGKGHVVDSDGNIAPYVSEGTDPLSAVAEGEKVNLRNAKTEVRNGVATLVLSGITEVVTADQQSVTVDGAPAATDGGDTAEDTEDSDEADTTEYDQPKPLVIDAVFAAVEARGNKAAPTEAVVGELDDMEEDTVEKTLEALKTEGAIQRMNGGYIPT